MISSNEKESRTEDIRITSIGPAIKKDGTNVLTHKALFFTNKDGVAQKTWVFKETLDCIKNVPKGGIPAEAVFTSYTDKEGAEQWNIVSIAPDFEGVGGKTLAAVAGLAFQLA